MAYEVRPGSYLAQGSPRTEGEWCVGGQQQDEKNNRLKYVFLIVLWICICICIFSGLKFVPENRANLKWRRQTTLSVGLTIFCPQQCICPAASTDSLPPGALSQPQDSQCLPSSTCSAAWLGAFSCVPEGWWSLFPKGLRHLATYIQLKAKVFILSFVDCFSGFSKASDVCNNHWLLLRRLCS